MRRPRIAIIGGGITGLTAAYHLRTWSKDNGIPIECTLYEASSRLGGKILTMQDRDFTTEQGPDSIFTMKKDGVDLLTDLGMADQIIHAKTGKTALLRNRTLYPMPRDLHAGIPAKWSSMALSPLLSLRGKLRALGDLVLPRSSETSVQTQSLGRLLRNRFGNEVVDQIAAPLLAGIHAADIDRMSIGDAAPAIAQLTQNHRSLLLGAKKSKKRGRHIPSAHTSSPFISLQGGLSALVEELFTKSQDVVQYKMDTVIANLRRESNGRYTFVCQTGDTSAQMEVDAVILATPAYATAAIVETFTGLSDLLRSIRYASTATVILGFPADTFPGSNDMTGFLVPRSERLSITACTIVSAKWPTFTNRKTVLVRCYVGRDGEEDLLTKKDEEIVQNVVDDLCAIWNVKLAPSFRKLTRWPVSMPQYDVGHAKRVARVEQLLNAFPGIVLAGSAYRGMGIPDCIKDGKRAAQHIIHHVTQME
ncbi:protoporphyrinogen oxidase [Ferroacidibacillus organovorans]|uniref:Coproporphyrinogen III oxidase n=1 Tax=Ferroacidibacillus organovorans TaxID=1765683 RepID=A0A117SXJ3_9BACL|nr:protoporphyrinogen oxidase [Ferroacidibacillus organovorans]KUO95433.1 hypothetical protein ATW55_02930 [Ferroacidibacillus organovorans]